MRVFAMRRHGFNEAIVLTAEGLPAGVICPPVTIPAGKEVADLVFKGNDDARDWSGFITVKGTAGDLVREARSGAIPWSVPNYDQDRARPRLATRLAFSVCAEEKAPLILQVPEQKNYEIELNGKVEFPVKLVRHFPVKGEVVIAQEGLPYAKNAPQLKLNDKTNEGTLAITFKKNKEFPIGPGTWRFSLKASGIVKHRHGLAGLERAGKESKRLEELEKMLQEEAKQARAAVEPAQKEVQEAATTLAGATADSKAGLEATLKEKQGRLKAAEDQAKAAEEKAKQATQAKTAVAERAKQAAERAKEKELQHSTFSLPITVVVKPPPPKEEGK